MGDHVLNEASCYLEVLVTKVANEAKNKFAGAEM